MQHARQAGEVVHRHDADVRKPPVHHKGVAVVLGDVVADLEKERLVHQVGSKGARRLGPDDPGALLDGGDNQRQHHAVDHPVDVPDDVVELPALKPTAECPVDAGCEGETHTLQCRSRSA